MINNCVESLKPEGVLCVCVCVWIVRAVQCREKKKKEDDRESWSKREDTNTKEEEPNALASRIASEEEYKMKGKRMYKRLKK